MLWPALAAIFAAAVSILLALGTCVFLCIATSEGITPGDATPASSDQGMMAYMICMGVAGVVPVVVASLVAAVTRRYVERHVGKSE